MERATPYSPADRGWLIGLAVFGFAVLNSVFVWAALFRPGALGAALTNPVSATMIADTMIVMGMLAWLLTRWGVSRLHWGWFVALSLLGGMVFALPVVLLWRGRGADPARK
jgi:hypothetical protein